MMTRYPHGPWHRRPPNLRGRADQLRHPVGSPHARPDTGGFVRFGTRSRDALLAGPVSRGAGPSWTRRQSSGTRMLARLRLTPTAELGDLQEPATRSAHASFLWSRRLSAG